MIDSIQPTLYIDPQSEIPAGYCSRCGGVLYYPGRHCLRCERELP